MSAYRIPKLQEDRDILIQSKHAVRHLESIAALLTCLSCEAERNDLTSMSCVLMELSNGMCDSVDKIETINKWVERKREHEQNKKD